MDEEASNRTGDLVRSLQTKIWIAAIRANSDYWKKVTRVDDPQYPTVYSELLDRIVAYGMYFLYTIIVFGKFVNSFDPLIVPVISFLLS